MQKCMFQLNYEHSPFGVHNESDAGVRYQLHSANLRGHQIENHENRLDVTPIDFTTMENHNSCWSSIKS